MYRFIIIVTDEIENLFKICSIYKSLDKSSSIKIIDTFVNLFWLMKVRRQ